jgi:large subunit ribosomal protein L13e
LAELKAAGLTPIFAKTVGIVVDHRRHGSNQMEEENIKRLNEYKTNLVLFPVKEGKPKKGEIHDTTEAAKDLKQNTTSGVIALPK